MYGALRQVSGLQTFLTGELLLIKRKNHQRGNTTRAPGVPCRAVVRWASGQTGGHAAYSPAASQRGT